MWLFIHGRTHTAALRNRRGINPTADCPFNCQADEDSMHLIRDCRNAIGNWQHLIHPSKWHAFTTLNGVEWVKWNLNNEAGKEFTAKIPWATLFGYTCWDIWNSRCKRLFGEADNDARPDDYSNFFRACADYDIKMRAAKHGNRRRKTYQDHSDSVNLVSDASVRNMGQSSCGGAILGSNNSWLCGFMCKLNRVPIAIAEVLGIVHGLYLCWQRGFKKVHIFSDSLEAIQLLTWGCEDHHPYRDIIEETNLLFLHRDWETTLDHIPREQNYLADQLVDSAHDIMGNYLVLEQPPLSLQGEIRNLIVTLSFL